VTRRTQVKKKQSGTPTTRSIVCSFGMFMGGRILWRDPACDEHNYFLIAHGQLSVAGFQS
jgi:hypothetical protein